MTKKSSLKRRRRAVRMVMSALDLKLAEKRDDHLRLFSKNSEKSANNSVDS